MGEPQPPCVIIGRGAAVVRGAPADRTALGAALDAARVGLAVTVVWAPAGSAALAVVRAHAAAHAQATLGVLVARLGAALGGALEVTARGAR